MGQSTACQQAVIFMSSELKGGDAMTAGICSGYLFA